MPFGHRHREQEEVYVVVAGSGRMKAGDELVEIAEWDVIRVAPSVMRAFEAGRTDSTCCAPEGRGRRAETPNATSASGSRRL